MKHGVSISIGENRQNGGIAVARNGAAISEKAKINNGIKTRRGVMAAARGVAAKMAKHANIMLILISAAWQANNNNANISNNNNVA
jgi:hypothetical protein